MRSSGEAMGVGRSFGAAVARAQQAVGISVKMPGRIFLSVRDADKARLVPVAREFIKRGFSLIATGGTWEHLVENGIECDHVNKVIQGRPHIVDRIKNDENDYIDNTTEGRQARGACYSIRRDALQR